MINNIFMKFNLSDCIHYLRTDKIIAYPTESVFGLGCNPDSKSAVDNLLKLKKRHFKKGFILVASNYSQLIPYISQHKLSLQQKKKMFSYWPGFVTFLVPANPNIPKWITGISNLVAVRVTKHKLVKQICDIFGKPIISTSANISGMEASRSIEEVFKYFGKDFPLLYGNLGNYINPSKIYNIITGEMIRDN